MRYKILLISLIGVLVLAACGGDSGQPADDTSGSDDDTTTDNSGNGSAASSADLTLEEGQFYAMQSSGAINYAVVVDNWGGPWPNRRLVDTGNWWTLRLGGSNSVDAEAISLINLEILKGIEPGTYTLNEGSIVSSPDADSPVTVMNFNIRYPDFQILNDEEEFDGSITIESISDEGMSGRIDVTLFGEGGEVQLSALFDVPVVEPFEPDSE